MVLKYLLTPLTPLYRGVIAARNLGFRSGALSATRLSVPVMSIGNLTFGGTGKTPTVISLVRELVRRGYRPAILTRGYKRRDRTPALVVGPDSEATVARVGDEALELASRLPGVPIAVDADRFAGAKEVLRRGADVLVMDDGFQHRRLHRDLDVVLIDAGDPWGGGFLPPVGRLREPRENLRRADAAVITKLPEGSRERFGELKDEIGRIAPGLPVFGAQLETTTLITPQGRQPLERLEGREVVALAGVGRPGGFLSTLKRCGALVVDEIIFRDHHIYKRDDIDRACERASSRSAILVTTGKDAVKLPADAPCWVVQVDMVPFGGSWDELLGLCPRLKARGG